MSQLRGRARRRRRRLAAGGGAAGWLQDAGLIHRVRTEGGELLVFASMTAREGVADFARTDSAHVAEPSSQIGVLDDPNMIVGGAEMHHGPAYGG